MIAIRRILCPIDFSDHSRRALDHAIAIARWYESTVTALHVFSPVSVAAYGPGTMVFDPIGLAPADRDQLLAETKAFIEAESAPGITMQAVVREVFLTPQFWDSATYFSRYSWPVEFVVRAIKDIGWVGLSVDTALAPLANMGQTLFDPPDVSGWDAGQTWFATGAMLARMNFASTLAANQRFNLASRAQPAASSPESFLSYFLDELVAAPMASATTGELLTYLRATGAWTASTAQVQSKAVGLVHLIAGSPEYQLI